jgi:DNA-binding transcriptional LysR family regulator
MDTIKVTRFDDSSEAPELIIGTAAVPQPGPGEMLVRVKAAGVTTTELHWYPTTHTKDGTVSTGAIPGGHLKAPPKNDTKKYQNYAKPCAETMHLRTMDLNLFRVFDAIMLHRSVRKASQMLSVTPSAVSHALRRLRQSIGDELFIPGESGMQPTRRALDLASAVREGLEKIELALRGKESVLADAFRTFRIAACDYACMVIVPSLVKRLAKSAPHADLRVFASNRLDVVRRLEKGQADLVIGWFNKLPGGIRRSTLLREDEVIVVRAGHPLTHSEVTKERLLEFPRLVVAPIGAEENEANNFMNDEGVARRLWTERVLHEFQDGKIDMAGRATVRVSHFAAMARFLQLTDMVATLPRRLALWAAADAPLVLLDLTCTSMTADIEMLWDQSADQDKGLQWLVNELAESVVDFG